LLGRIRVELRRAELNYLQSNDNSGNFSFTSGMTAVNALNPSLVVGAEHQSSKFRRT